MKKISLILIIVFSCITVKSQFYNTGQDPYSTNWKEINTTNFQIVYPHKFEDKAQYLANIFSYLYDKIPNSLNHSPKKISIVIHAKSAKSNVWLCGHPKEWNYILLPHKISKLLLG